MNYVYQNGNMVPTETIRRAETEQQNRRALVWLSVIGLAWVVGVFLI